MRDRQPLDPNRVLITPENGATPFYATITRADNPVDVGHRLNKATLLKDITCGMLGLDPQTAVPDDALQMLAALASSGGSGSGDVGELEDLTIRVGSFVNAGAGWNTYRFPEPFDAPPQIVREFTDGSVATGSYYTASGTSSSSSHSLQTLVSGVTLPTGQTTEAAVQLLWLAIDFNGGE